MSRKGQLMGRTKARGPEAGAVAAPKTDVAPEPLGLPVTGDHALDLRDAERETAIARVFDQHHAQLVRLAALLGAGHEAEDVVAEAFCQLYRRWSKLRSSDAALAYVRGAVVNLVRMRLRHLQVVRRHSERTRPPADSTSAEHDVLLREDQRALVVALDALAERQREVIVLRYWMDLKESEIAAAMGISCGAVKSHAARAMASLARAMEKED
jgi:RNA polymerase sigma-70 factor (sigma-E family)